MKSKWLLAFSLVAACGRATSFGQRDVDAKDAERVASNVPPQASASSAAPRANPQCAAVTPAETIGDGQGRASEHGFVALENLRVIAREDSWLVSWERQSHFAIGDSWRAPYAAVRRGNAAFRVVEFPVDAYACATSGFIAPSSLAEAVTWGVANTRGFELWPKLPRATKNDLGEARVAPGSARSVPTRKQEVGTFVVSGGVALATTIDGQCDILCTCSEGWKAALWIYGLDPEARFAERVALATKALPPSLDNDVPNAPALVVGEHAGAAAFRSGRALFIVWLDRTGKPQGVPMRFDEGDVGAPALAFAGRDLLVVWAHRTAKAEAFRLRFMRLAPSAVPGAARDLPTRGSALAPALLADESSMVLAWMEGDLDRRGAIHVARAELEEPKLVSTVISTPEETNARDPELSGTLDAPALVYASFPKTHPGGEVRFARLRCGPR